MTVAMAKAETLDNLKMLDGFLALMRMIFPS